MSKKADIDALKKYLKAWKEPGKTVQVADISGKTAEEIIAMFETGELVGVEATVETTTDATATTDKTKIIIAMAPSKPGTE
jgi:hypothetical protein